MICIFLTVEWAIYNYIEDGPSIEAITQSTVIFKFDHYRLPKYTHWPFNIWYNFKLEMVGILDNNK